MNSHFLGAIRSQPGAIMPEYLAAIEAIALRALDHPAIVAVEADGHKERMVEAVAEMGGRFPGSRNATIREGVGCLPLFGPVFPRQNMMTAMSDATAPAHTAADFRKLEAQAEWHQILLPPDDTCRH